MTGSPGRPVHAAGERRGQRREPRRFHLVRVVAALIRSELTATAAYRAQMILSAFGWVVPLVMLVIWRTASSQRPDLTAGQITTYFLATLILTLANPVIQVVFGYAEPIRTGQMSALLLRPIHPIWALTARGAAQVVSNLVAGGIMVVVVAWLAGAAPVENRAAVPTAVGCFVIGLIGVGYLASMIGSIAFWSTRAEGVQSLIFAAEWLLGGLVAPFAVVGGWWEAIGRHQPFWLALGAPAELLAGLRQPGWPMMGEMMLGVVWIGVLHVVHRRVWRAAVRHHEAVGS